MRIELYRERTESPLDCAACSLSHHLRGVETLLILADERIVGNLCPSCLDSGEQGIRERLIAQAKMYRQIAKEFDDAAEEALDGFEVPSIEELETFEKLADDE